MYNNVGVYQVGVEFEFLDTILTERGILEESIGLNQFLRVKDITYFPEKKFLVIDCDLYEHLIN